MGGGGHGGLVLLPSLRAFYYWSLSLGGNCLFVPFPLGRRGGAVVRALPSHQCSIPRWCRMWAEFVVGSPLAMRGFSLGTSPTFLDCNPSFLVDPSRINPQASAFAKSGG